MKLSVVILNYNVKHFLQLCLQSVFAAIQDMDAEIIVIDNASSDDSAVMVKKHFPKVKWIQNTENVGFSKANNQAVKAAKGTYLCILNPDTVVPEDGFKKLIAFAEEKPNLGILGCQLIDGLGAFLPESKRNVPTPKVAIQKILGQNTTYYANHISKDDVGKASIFVGAFMIVKKSVYEQVGGFDERYFMYGEDIDLSYKIEKAGYTNYYKGDVSVIHYKGESTLKDKIYAKRFYGAMQIFYKTHFRKNILFDAFVTLSTKLLPVIAKEKNLEDIEVDQYIYHSNKLLPKLQMTLKKQLLLSQQFFIRKKNRQYILDANQLTFKEIISFMKIGYKAKNGSTFKIQPQKSNYILGSNSSKTKGEIIHF